MCAVQLVTFLKIQRSFYDMIIIAYNRRIVNMMNYYSINKKLGIGTGGGGTPYVLPVATTTTLGGIKPDGATTTVSADGVLTAISSASITEKYGIKGDYATQYGILECPNGILSVDGMQVTLKQGVVMQCAGQDIKTTVATDMPFTITATNDVDLFYAGGTILECGDVFYQESEPEDGSSNYAAWWKPSLGKWQFKSDDTGNVYREAIACRLAHIHTDGTTITRVDYIGNRILDDEIFLEVPKVETDTATTITIANTVPGTAYTYGTITSLTITTVKKSTVECTIEFTAGDTITVNLPSTLQ